MTINLDLLDFGRQLFWYILVSIGYSKIFEKCGTKGGLGFVPFLREYNLSLCAHREEDGVKLVIVTILEWIAGIVSFVLLILGYDKDVQAVAILLIVLVAIIIYKIVYLSRVYLGIIDAFGRRKWWLFLFIIIEAPTLLLWGFSKKFVPVKKVEDLSSVDQAKTLDADVAKIDDGLTVNLKSRTVPDFFKKKVLLKDIHMSIPKGHMVLLLGGSGAGKTTYLNAITGYEKADATVTLGEGDVYEDYGKMMYDIGFVPQQDLMRGSDTVALTLADAAAMRLPANVSIIKRNKRIAEVLEQFGLTTVKNSLVEKLSGGQRKRLSIAIEFISDPSLFILDEPDSGLDGVVARALFEKLRSIADEGKIVVVITHTPDRVIDLFDDVIVLAKDAARTGRLAYYGPVKEAYEFFGKSSMEDILRSINQQDEGGEGRADEFVEKYADHMSEIVG